MPGISGATRTPDSMPRERSSSTASRRAAGLGVCGSVARQAASSRVGTERLTETGTFFAIRSKRSMSRSTNGDFVSTVTGVSAASSASRISGMNR